MSSFSRLNKGYKYLLTVIDVFSKYGWIVPLETKTEKEVAQAFRKLFHNGHPSRLWTDKGTEFYNRHLKGVVEATENEEKSSVVERWSRTMKNIMCKYCTASNTQKYIDVLPSKKCTFEEGFTPNWTENVYTICSVLSRISLENQFEGAFTCKSSR